MHGIKAYQQTINLKNKPPDSDAQKDSLGKMLNNAQDNAQGVVVEKRTRTPKAADEFYKTSKKPGASASSDGFLRGKQESKYRRVAKFLILIGSEQAAEILAELDPEQVSEISREIAFIKVIKPEEKDEIFAEFHTLFSRPYRFLGSSRGGIEAARRILYAAKGPEKGEALLNKAVPESKENLFSFLEDFSAEQLAMVIKTETDQTASLILSRLPPKLSANTLTKLPQNRKPEILRRMAHQSEVSPEVLEQVSAALKEKVRHIGGGANDIKIDGMKTLAAILKQGDYSFGDRIVNELVQDNPEIGKDLKENLYTLADVVNAIDRPIQDKLAEMPERDIA
ncbi:MAG: flagellar motor switch protein FliG, partial [Treponema sp.]|nr:flagellar motor switch protein FliG [Treponema sp.]